MKTRFLALLLAVVSSLLVSCSVNAPTPSSQITAAPVSELKYADYTCASLTAVLESLGPAQS
jgi:outer membrane biogenesis lipoprotein LolB